MKCDICGQDFANSEEIKAHMERDHTLEEREEDAGLEKPDMMRDEAEPAPAAPNQNM